MGVDSGAEDHFSSWQRRAIRETADRIDTNLHGGTPAAPRVEKCILPELERLVKSLEPMQYARDQHGGGTQ